MEIDIKESGFIVKKLRSSRFSLPYSEEDLLKDLTFNKAHGDLLTNPLLIELDNKAPAKLTLIFNHDAVQLTLIYNQAALVFTLNIDQKLKVS